jgi:integrase
VWTNDVPFDGVTVKFCNGWENKMRTEGLAEITLSVKFRTLRAVLNKAISEEYSRPDAYPFARNESEKRKFFIGKFKTKTVKRAIAKADVDKIKAYEPTPYVGPYASLRDPTDRLQWSKDLFLFSYYVGGINFVDMAQMRWKNIALGLDGKPRLNYTRQKNGGDFSIRLIPAALAILERYRPLTETNANAYVFPILNTALHKTPQQRHNRCNKILGQVNKDLKTIATSVGIATKLTSYVARHTMGTVLRREGTPDAVIGQIYQHPDATTTRIYLDEFESSVVDAAFDNL